MQTGAGSVLNAFRAPAGSTLAVFGTGGVGLSAVMAGVIAGCTTIVGVDIRPKRLELALELGATHVIEPSQRDVVAEIQRITGRGVDFALETTGSVEVLRQAVESTAPAGTTGIVGAPPGDAEVALNVNSILSVGRTVRGIVEGESVPPVFIPRLVELWRQGRFPIDRLMTFYDFDQIDEAAHDAEAGTTIKPVLRM